MKGTRATYFLSSVRFALVVFAFVGILIVSATGAAWAEAESAPPVAAENGVQRQGPPPPAANPPVQESQDSDGVFNPLSPIPRGAFREDGSILPGEDLFSQSLLFTPLEVGALVNMLVRKSRMDRQTGPRREGPRGLEDLFAPDGTPLFDEDIVEKPPAEAEVTEEPGSPPVLYPPIPQQRSITLSGVLYRAPGDWAVWINGQKVVPSRLLPEIVDIRVERDRVHLKWFDIGLGRVLALTLRPNQTYDIVSSTLLRGGRQGESAPPPAPTMPEEGMGGAEGQAPSSAPLPAPTFLPPVLQRAVSGATDNLGLPPIEPIPGLPEMKVIEGADFAPSSQ